MTIQNPVSDLFGYQLRRASAAMMADLIAHLSDLELRPTDASILILIEANPGITQSEVGRTLAVKRANMVPLTASYIERGFVTRVQVDGRSQALQLTPLGQSIVQECHKRIHAHEESFLANFSSIERDEIARNIKRLWHDKFE